MSNTNESYVKKLESPKWQRRRLEIMQSAGWKCAICGDDNEKLHVHHLGYIPGNDPWDYADNSLQCLCATCHSLRHADQEKIKAFASKVFEFVPATSDLLITRALQWKAEAIKWEERARKAKGAV